MRQVLRTSIFLWILLIVFGLYIGFIFIFSWYSDIAVRKTWDAMMDTEFACEEGTEASVRPWSKGGKMRYCEPKKNGPWEAWSEGYIQIQGSFRYGEKDGEWRWFNSDGSVNRVMVYKNGNIISDTGLVK